MKKIFYLFLAVLVLFGSITVLAEESGLAVENLQAEEKGVEKVAPLVYETQNELTFHAEIISEKNEERHFAFLLYACDGQTVLGRRYVNTASWETSFNMVFSVPEYNIGEKFIVKLFSDNADLVYNGITGNETVIETYVYSNEAGEVVYQTAFFGEIIPKETKPVKLKVEDNIINADVRIFGNEIYVSEDMAEELNILLTKNEDSWTMKSQTEDFFMNFYKDNIYATKNYEGYNLNYPVFEDGGKAYFPLYDIAVYFACSYEEETGEERIVSMKKSYYSIGPEKEKFVNNSLVDSKTEYLIWISKSTYTVNVFTGEKGNWHLIKEYPCALGAKNSPTIEGQFEYIERLNRWSYAYYYCGPVMRFHNGYALHSTLIRYDGTAYDDRVGVNISHGCIRLHPADIEELIEFIPFKTRIYITAE